MSLHPPRCSFDVSVGTFTELYVQRRVDECLIRDVFDVFSDRGYIEGKELDAFFHLLVDNSGMTVKRGGRRRLVDELQNTDMLASSYEADGVGVNPLDLHRWTLFTGAVFYIINGGLKKIFDLYELITSLN